MRRTGRQKGSCDVTGSRMATAHKPHMDGAEAMQGRVVEIRGQAGRKHMVGKAMSVCRLA